MPKTARRKDLAKIHIAKKELGLGEDTYRAIVASVMDERGLDGPASSANLGAEGRSQLLGILRDMGWSPQGGGGPQPWKGYFDVPGGPDLITQPQADYISKMAHEKGWLPDEPHRLAGWIERQTGHESSVDLLTRSRAHKVITGLQKLTSRR